MTLSRCINENQNIGDQSAIYFFMVSDIIDKLKVLQLRKNCFSISKKQENAILDCFYNAFISAFKLK